MVNKLLSRINPPISAEKAIKISDEYQFRVISTKEEADKFNECAPLLISVAKASIEAQEREILKFGARDTKFYLEKEDEIFGHRLADGNHLILVMEDINGKALGAIEVKILNIENEGDEGENPKIFIGAAGVFNDQRNKGILGRLNNFALPFILNEAKLDSKIITFETTMKSVEFTEGSAEICHAIPNLKIWGSTFRAINEDVEINEKWLLEDGGHKFERKYSLNDFLIEALKKPLIDEDKVHQWILHAKELERPNRAIDLDGCAMRVNCHDLESLLIKMQNKYKLNNVNLSLEAPQSSTSPKTSTKLDQENKTTTRQSPNI